MNKIEPITIIEGLSPESSLLQDKINELIAWQNEAVDWFAKAENPPLLSNHVTLKLPKGQRIGQALANFLIWLKVEKDYHSDMSFDDPKRPFSDSRMADPFHISDEQFMELWEEWRGGQE